MRCKHRLSEKILHRLFDEEETADEPS